MNGLFLEEVEFRVHIERLCGVEVVDSHSEVLDRHRGLVGRNVADGSVLDGETRHANALCLFAVGGRGFFLTGSGRSG